MAALKCTVTSCNEETPVEPGCYRLEDIQRATPLTREELMKRGEDSTMAQPYVFHVISEITPSAYSETPRDDLVAELAKMKAMMEQMRLDKERLEMDAKRYEMEAKRKEEEEADALRKIQEQELAVKEKKELDVVFSLFRNRNPMWSNSETTMEYLWKNAGEEESKFLRSLEASGETILLAHVDTHVLKCPSNGGSPSHKRGVLRFVLTNCHLYDCMYKWVKNPILKCDYCNIDTCVFLKTGTFYASKLYSFTNPLQIAHAKILTSIMTAPTMGGGPAYPCQSLLTRIEYVLCSQRDRFVSGGTSVSDALKKFESIIRLIPGSYKNGNWRQLDGFFGMYFNEETMEVSEVPPPL